MPDATTARSRAPLRSAAPAEPEYDGTSPLPADDPAPPPRDTGQRVYVTVKAVIVVTPFLALGLAVWLLRGSSLHPADLVLAAVLCVATGLGVTVGFHRGLTHGSFRARRPPHLAPGVAGSLSFRGEVITRVATHRRRHAFTDRPGDPHSPFRYGTHPTGQLRGMLPFGAGWAIGGTWVRGLTALVWAGLVRIALLHHVTWSVNSLCHMIGDRPFLARSHDRATNLWPLALLSFGESRHDLHYADSTCARRCVDRGQLDPSAAATRLFERLGRVHDVRWPSVSRLDARRA